MDKPTAINEEEEEVEIEGNRYIVFSFVLTENLVINDEEGYNNDALTGLADSLNKALSKLRPDDYVCFNIANAQVKLFDDFQ